jgi:neutral amino acid transport system permease protein
VAILLALGLAFTGSVLAEKQLFAGMRKRTPAQGKMITAGGMAAIAVVSVAIAIMASRGGVTLIVAAVLAALAGAVLGGGLELGLFKPLRSRGTGLVSMLVITIGLSFLLRHIFLLGTVFGSAPRRYNDYALQPDGLEFGPISVAPRDAAVILASGLVLAAVGFFLQRTRLGKAMRAVADNKDLAESSGIDVQRVILSVWIMGGTLAALGGVLQALTSAAVEYDMGFVFLLLMFSGIIVGGIGTAFGAMVGGLAIGIASEVSTLWISVELKLVLAFMLLIVVLLVRPTGILGRAERFG